MLLNNEEKVRNDISIMNAFTESVILNNSDLPENISFNSLSFTGIFDTNDEVNITENITNIDYSNSAQDGIGTIKYRYLITVFFLKKKFLCSF